MVRISVTEEQMEIVWVFAGSVFWKVPQDGSEFYQADSGDMICVSNFSTAMMDVPIASSAQANELMYIPYTDRIPERGMPVRLVLVPIPIPSDTPAGERANANKVDPNKPPSEAILPARAKKRSNDGGEASN